jgi:hypothetical protein
MQALSQSSLRRLRQLPQRRILNISPKSQGPQSLQGLLPGLELHLRLRQKWGPKIRPNLRYRQEMAKKNDDKAFHFRHRWLAAQAAYPLGFFWVVDVVQLWADGTGGSSDY